MESPKGRVIKTTSLDDVFIRTQEVWWNVNGEFKAEYLTIVWENDKEQDKLGSVLVRTSHGEETKAIDSHNEIVKKLSDRFIH